MKEFKVKTQELLLRLEGIKHLGLQCKSEVHNLIIFITNNLFELVDEISYIPDEKEVIKILQDTFHPQILGANITFFGYRFLKHTELEDHIINLINPYFSLATFYKEIAIKLLAFTTPGTYPRSWYNIVPRNRLGRRTSLGMARSVYLAQVPAIVGKNKFKLEETYPMVQYSLNVPANAYPTNYNLVVYKSEEKVEQLKNLVVSKSEGKVKSLNNVCLIPYKKIDENTLNIYKINFNYNGDDAIKRANDIIKEYNGQQDAESKINTVFEKENLNNILANNLGYKKKYQRIAQPGFFEVRFEDC